MSLQFTEKSLMRNGVESFSQIKIYSVHSIRFSALKIIEMLYKSLSLMTIQKFQLFKLNFCWPVLTIWVIISAHKYHICVLLFITFHLTCNMSIFRDTSLEN